MPISPGGTKDDKIISDLSTLLSCEDAIWTEKMDGENTTIWIGGTHARSPDGRYHPSRALMKAYAAERAPLLRHNEYIRGEYLYARHSIEYDSLPSYFMGFGWVVDGVVQSWDDTLQRFCELSIEPVPLLHRGAFSEKTCQELARSLDLTRQEGFVVRTAASFHEDDMPTCMGKYVREGHVQTDEHWMHQEIVKNGLAP